MGTDHNSRSSPRGNEDPPCNVADVCYICRGSFFGVVCKFGEGVPAQMSPSWSLDQDKKKMRSITSSPRVASATVENTQPRFFQSHH
ncbi:hypothetical protein TNCV_4068361 [Trichonephila clavipes]|nr:hypothetical protein TNCV_4068361 [Trichonephila clavipes]